MNHTQLTNISIAGLREQLSQESNAGRRIDLIDLALCPPEPQLLDTCIVQNLDWVDRQIEANNGHDEWDEAKEAELSAQFGKKLADDLLDLGTLYKQFENRSGYPWVVCSAALDEAGVFGGAKATRVQQMLNFIAGHQDDLEAAKKPGK